MPFANNLLSAHVAILGLGLMGGSLALALHKKCAKITVYDIDPNVTSMAEEKKIVDQATTDLHKAVQDANLIILAAPVKAILTLLKALSDFQEGEVGEAVILDLGSTKVQITEMMENLPAQFDPIGGHPMCGKETSGLINAEPGLFHRKVFALTRLRDAHRICAHLNSGVDSFWEL